MTDRISNGVKELAKRLRNILHARVLDVGPGLMGKNSVFLVKKEHYIDAIDKKKRWVERIKKIARTERFIDRMDAREGDIRTARLGKGKYDAVLMCYVIHLMKDERTARSVFRKTKSATKPSGYNLIEFFIQWPGINNEPDRFIPAPGKIQEIYKDWKIVKYVESPKLFYKGNWEKRAWLIAKKMK